MTRITLIAAIAAAGIALQASAAGEGIIPAPASIATPATSRTIDVPGAELSLTVNGAVKSDVANLSNAFRAAFPTPENASRKIRCRIDIRPEAAANSEGYTLAISSNGIKITAPTAAGAFYAIQTLRAMADAEGGRLSECVVTDQPRFAYRGMMLDVSRNFQDKEFVKKQIDAMARLKLNNLHLHLTDAAGWRIQIDSAPELTHKAAWRVGDTWKDWNASGNLYSTEGADNASGGYYTKDDIREIVDYAKARYINVIPEIEMPGHSEEVLAAYPSLSCSGHAEKGESDFCAANDSTFTLLQSVLDEVIELFPSKLIHIGGDEASKAAWRKCPRCLALMDSLGLDDVDGLQSYFIGRIEKYLNSRGRDMLGWDEIMQGGLAPNATVMSWRGTEGGEKAAAMGHNVIMTPGRYCYLDGYQDAPSTQPEAIGGYLPLQLAYSYNPVPPSLAGTPGEKFIYGLQGNLFTEYVVTPDHVEYMLYPRMFAIAERGWSPAERTDFDDFHARAAKLGRLMTAEGYHPFDLDNEVGNRPEAKAPIAHLAAGKNVAYLRQPWDRYPANGKQTLTDGVRGGWNYNDERWQAFVGSDGDAMDVVIDLGEPTELHEVSADFMQICGPGVYMPGKVAVELSDDNTNWRRVAETVNKVEADNDVSFKNFGWKGSDTARYVRFRAALDEKFPGVLFTDEIVVR